MDQFGLTKEEKTYGMLCHLLSLSGFIIPFGTILGPLIIWLMKKDQSKFVDDQGKESLNFQISIIIYMIAGVIASVILMIVVIGFVLIFLVPIAIGLFALIMAIIASIRANEGQTYRYPLTIRLIK